MSPTTKTSKAALRRQSLSRAKEWATDRKKKKDVIAENDDDIDEPKPVESDAEEEAAAAAKDKTIEKKLASATTRRSTRSTRGGRASKSNEENQENIVNDADDTENIGSGTRRSSRRRTMTGSIASTPVVTARPPTRRSTRKSMTPVVEQKTPERKVALKVEEDSEDVKQRELPTRRSTRKTMSPVVEKAEQKTPQREEVEEVEEGVKQREVPSTGTRRSRRLSASPAVDNTREDGKVEEELDVVKSEAVGNVSTRRSRTKIVYPKAEEEEEEEEEENNVKVETEEEVVQEEIVVKSEDEETVVIVEETDVELEVVKGEITVESDEEGEEEEVVQEETVIETDEEQVKIESIEEEIKEEEVETEVEDNMANYEEPKVEVEEEPEIEVKEIASEEKANQMSPKQTQSKIGSLLDLFPVFFHVLVVLWTLSFAVMMSFGFDWYLSHASPDIGSEDNMLSHQRAPCATLGLWLVSIVAFSIAFGPRSVAGWILTGLSLTMASFSTTLVTTDETTPVPSLPIYSHSDIDVKMLDLLVVLCLLGTITTLKRPAAPQEQPQVVNAFNEGDAPEAESQVETQAETFKEEDAVVAPEEAITTGPRSLIGQRVAVEKGIDAILGTVKDYDAETREWLIQYDGDELGEEEVLNRVQLGSAFKLYSKHLADVFLS